MLRIHLEKIACLLDLSTDDLCQQLGDHVDGNYWDVTHWIVTVLCCPNDAELFGDAMLGEQIYTLQACLDIITWHLDEENITDVLIMP